MSGPPPLPGARWRRVRSASADFSAGEKPDPRRWEPRNPWFAGRPPCLFSPRLVSCAGGELRLGAEETAHAPDSSRRFLTSILRSRARYGYGYYEASIRTMAAGVCNAFWLYDPLPPSAKHRPGGFSEEIDIVEIFGRATNPADSGIAFHTVHRLATPYFEARSNGGVCALPDKSARVPLWFDPAAGFHDYGLLWTPEELRWYVDGRETFRRRNDFYHRPLRIMLDCEIMLAWDGLPRAADLPAQMR
ncbi:MAG: family 16 glycosylhydrolase, partial [Kiritimatiellae bacterium]|nr:family 16 glycosylhydrolase [Kiritimatiellia bacterium]